MRDLRRGLTVCAPDEEPDICYSAAHLGLKICVPAVVVATVLSMFISMAIRLDVGSSASITALALAFVLVLFSIILRDNIFRNL